MDEQAARQRHNHTAMNWRFLRQTLDAMTQQLDQSRAQLYQRYLEHPDDWLLGFINTPALLPSQRPADAAASDVRRRKRRTLNTDAIVRPSP